MNNSQLTILLEYVEYVRAFSGNFVPYNYI